MKEPFYIRPLKLAASFVQEELERRSSSLLDSDLEVRPDSPAFDSINQAQHVLDAINSALNQSKFLYTLKKDRRRL